MAGLGKLERVELRDAWSTEDQHFTPWLALPENIEILGKALNIDLVVEAVELYVGNYRADIVCENTEDSSRILIENQLTRTDHGHLGQILTYTAGTNAKTVIWIAERFAEEHREALDWLNQHTDDEIQFFGLEIELWRIDQSPPAPKFNIVSKPNNWTSSIRRVAKRISGDALSDTLNLYLRYWTRFSDFMDERQSMLRGGKKPQPASWMTFAIGRSGFHLDGLLSIQKKRIGVELYIGGDGAADYFRLLEQDKERIEIEFGEALEWHELPDKKKSRILLLVDKDPADEDVWDDQFDWMANRLEKLHQVFAARIKLLNLDASSEHDDI
jgi:uncharacterized protein DUF4268